MEQKYPVHNPGQMPIYVGATMIPGGETRHFNLEDIPHHLRPAPEAPVEETAPTDLVADLQKKPIKEVVEGTELLNDADLQRLIDLEAASEKPRKSLLSSLAEIQMQRAEAMAALLAGGVVELQKATEIEILSAIPQLTDLDLQELAELESAAETPRQAVLDAVAALQQQRAAAGPQ